jgi:hypothetical protein
MADHPYSPEFNAWLMRNDMDRQQILHEILSATNEAAQEKVDWRELCARERLTITEAPHGIDRAAYVANRLPMRTKLRRWVGSLVILAAYCVLVAGIVWLVVWIGRVM